MDFYRDVRNGRQATQTRIDIHAGAADDDRQFTIRAGGGHRRRRHCQPCGNRGTTSAVNDAVKMMRCAAQSSVIRARRQQMQVGV